MLDLLFDSRILSTGTSGPESPPTSPPVSQELARKIKRTK
jgi:hypothetical protein